MALQEISLSTAPAQVSAPSGGAASVASAAGPTAFLMLMQTASAASQGKTAKGQAASDGTDDKTQGQPPGDENSAALPSGASALAALFSAQAAGRNPNAAGTAAGTAQSATATAGPAAQTQTAPVQPALSSAVPEGAALLQAVPTQQDSAGPASPPASARKAETFSQQLPSVASQAQSAQRAASTRGASDSGAPAQAAAFIPTQQAGPGGQTSQTASAPQATIVSQAASVQQAQTAQAALAPQSSAAADPAQAFSPPSRPDPSDKIVLLSSGGFSDGVRPAGTAGSSIQDSAASGVPGSAGLGPAGKAQGDTRQTGAAARDFPGGPGREDVSPANSATVADLYTGGKVVVKVSDQAARTQASPSRQVADAVAEGFKSGVRQLKVDLYPEALGKVSVKLVAKDGLLTVQLTADSAKTQSLLASSSGEIRSLLQNATGQPVQVARPEQTAAQQWYAQDGGAGGQDRQPAPGRQQQESGRRRKDEGPYPSGSDVGAISTDDFLTIIRKTAGA